MTALLNWLDGKKSYIVALATVVYGVLVLTGVTADDIGKWAQIAGGAFVSFGGALGALRSAYKKSTGA